MKSLLFTFILVAIFSCNNASKQSHIRKYDTTDWFVTMPSNENTFDGGSKWVRRVIATDKVPHSDTADDGTVTTKSEWLTDTLYLLRTVDPTLPYLDSTGKQIIDPQTKQPVYYLSWAHPFAVPKDIVKEQFPIPQRFIPILYNHIPSPSSFHTPDTKTTPNPTQPQTPHKP